MSRVELCDFLLGRGANANTQDNQGRYNVAQMFFSKTREFAAVVINDISFYIYSLSGQTQDVWRAPKF